MTTIQFTIPAPLASSNLIKGGNAKGNFHIRKKLHQEWKDLTIVGLRQSGIFNTYSLTNCIINVISYYKDLKTQIDTENLYTKPVVDALIGHIYHDDSPRYVRTVSKTSELIAKGEKERTEIVIKGIPDKMPKRKFPLIVLNAPNSTRT